MHTDVAPIRHDGFPQRAAFAVAMCMVIGALVGGCQMETRVVRYRAPLAGLPGAEHAADIKPMSAGVRSSLDRTPTQIRFTDESGQVRLVARSGNDLIVHIYETLRDGEKDLFTDQILSTRTRGEYIARGKSPGDAFDDLRARSDDVVDLFNMMPHGEFTPGVFLKPIGKDTFRLEVTGLAARDINWTAMDMVIEGGQYKLIWFGRPSRR